MATKCSLSSNKSSPSTPSSRHSQRRTGTCPRPGHTLPSPSSPSSTSISSMPRQLCTPWRASPALWTLPPPTSPAPHSHTALTRCRFPSVRYLAAHPSLRSSSPGQASRRVAAPASRLLPRVSVSSSRSSLLPSLRRFRRGLRAVR